MVHPFTYNDTLFTNTYTTPTTATATTASYNHNQFINPALLQEDTTTSPANYRDNEPHNTMGQHNTRHVQQRLPVADATDPTSFGNLDEYARWIPTNNTAQPTASTSYNNNVNPFAAMPSQTMYQQYRPPNTTGNWTRLYDYSTRKWVAVPLSAIFQLDDYSRIAGPSTSEVHYPSYSHPHLPTPAQTPNLDTLANSFPFLPEAYLHQVDQGRDQSEYNPHNETGAIGVYGESTAQAFDPVLSRGQTAPIVPVPEVAIPELPLLPPAALARHADHPEANVEAKETAVVEAKKPIRRQRAPRSTRTKSERNQIRNARAKKPYARSTKPIAGTSNAQADSPIPDSNPRSNPSDNWQDWVLAVAAESRTVPPSPTIQVSKTKVPPSKRTGATLRSHICRGLGPSEDERIVATGPAEDATVEEQPRSIAGTQDVEWRCRWDGCHYVSRATLMNLRAHLQVGHGIQKSVASGVLAPEILVRDEEKGKLKVRCQWRPPLRVKLPGYKEPVLVSSHRLAYPCNTLIDIASVENHIGVHLRYEKQPNMHVVGCCTKQTVGRGAHKCSQKKPMVEEQRDKGFEYLDTVMDKWSSGEEPAR